MKNSIANRSSSSSSTDTWNSYADRLTTSAITFSLYGFDVYLVNNLRAPGGCAFPEKRVNRNARYCNLESCAGDSEIPRYCRMQ